jgi:predicted nuclease with TOPRIM domain
LKQKEAEVDSTNKNLKEVTEETDDLREANTKLEKECAKAQEEYKELCHKLENSCNKNK